MAMTAAEDEVDDNSDVVVVAAVALRNENAELAPVASADGSVGYREERNEKELLLGAAVGAATSSFFSLLVPPPLLPPFKSKPPNIVICCRS